jgi:hypothetical protein
MDPCIARISQKNWFGELIVSYNYLRGERMLERTKDSVFFKNN